VVVTLRSCTVWLRIVDTVPFKSKLTLDSQYSILAEIENQVENWDSQQTVNLLLNGTVINKVRITNIYLTWKYNHCIVLKWWKTAQKKCRKNTVIIACILAAIKLRTCSFSLGSQFEIISFNFKITFTLSLSANSMSSSRQVAITRFNWTSHA